MRGRLLVFGGTTEGTELARQLPSLGWQVTICVATAYGAELLQGCAVEVRTGRLDEEAMTALMGEGYCAVIDATHPYAVEVTRTVRAAAKNVGLPFIRLLREDTSIEGDWILVPTAQAAAELLQRRSGNILLTTGSKDLAVYTALPDYRKRIWVRILASEASLHQALGLGYPARHIVAMHGPFSAELNTALLRQFDIRTMVTKRSGISGGFAEKVQAARETGVELVVIDRPKQEQGKSLEEVLQLFSGEHLEIS